MKNSFIRIFEYDLIEREEKRLRLFYSHLKETQTSPPLIERRISNADLFSIQYHAYHYLEPIEHVTDYRINDFLQRWYFERVLNSSESDWQDVKNDVTVYLSHDHTIFGDIDHGMHIINLIQEINYNPTPDSRHEPAQTVFNRHNHEGIQIRQTISQAFSRQIILNSNPNPTSEKSAEEIIDDIESIATSIRTDRNIISLSPATTACNNHREDHNTSLDDALFEIIRSHFVFERWMKRFQLNLKDLETEWAEIYTDFLERIERLARLKETISKDNEIRKKAHIIERFGQWLWAIRRLIAEDSGLDSRALHS